MSRLVIAQMAGPLSHGFCRSWMELESTFLTDSWWTAGSRGENNWYSCPENTSCFVVMWEFLGCVLLSWGSSSVSVTFWVVCGGKAAVAGVWRQDSCGCQGCSYHGRLSKVDRTAPQSLQGARGMKPLGKNC